jgi:hypothetical protein
VDLTTSRELGRFMVEIAQKNGFVPSDSGTFLETYKHYPKFFSKVCESEEMVKFIVLRKDAIWLMNHLFD